MVRSPVFKSTINIRIWTSELFLSDISGFHSGGDSGRVLLGCDAVWCCGRIPTPGGRNIKRRHNSEDLDSNLHSHENLTFASHVHLYYFVSPKQGGEYFWRNEGPNIASGTVLVAVMPKSKFILHKAVSNVMIIIHKSKNETQENFLGKG